MTIQEMAETYASLFNNRMTKSEHEQMADNYDKLAKHYDDLAEEARKHAASHRELAQKA